ncbi:cation diffusion facilitator family transporter [Variovorax soli]|uniref:Cation diffusion facilitator family transporter n=1 Tax=Variovorax soli TaxID=376815 RepID=A0ABU1NFH2_9BURK|nr:cation diffusion facilitator family transporter [Variovorax soli]MDR6537215.1 cation diffusion facilitator family transporter [Variovorax soli]
MSANCCEHDHDHEHPSASDTPRYRRVLWVALALNALMFAVEIGAGFRSGSVSLLADAIDFFGDAANYGVTLAVLSMGLAWRTRAALLKGVSMVGFGLFVAGRTLWSAAQGLPPEALTMGLVGALALGVNVAVALMLYAFREGDANMRSVWLCSRNDAIGNVAVMLAALGVLGTGTPWPDLAVGAAMAALALSGGWSVLRQARGELGRAGAGQAKRA